MKAALVVIVCIVTAYFAIGTGANATGAIQKRAQANEAAAQ